MSTTQSISKKLYFFYVIEIISAAVYTFKADFLGLIWLAVAISLVALIPKLLNDKFNPKQTRLISQVCLLISSIIWGYIVMYYLSANPVLLTTILVFRILATLLAFKELREHMFVVVPLLIGFALLKQAGCIPPLAF